MTCDWKARWFAAAAALALTVIPCMAQEAEPQAPKPVIKVYDVGDLVRPARQYPYRSDVLPISDLLTGQAQLPPPPAAAAGGVGFGGGGLGAAGGAPQPANAAGRPAPAASFDLYELIDLLRETVDPQTWVPLGTIGNVRPLGNLLVISQTPDSHAKIEDLLAQLRQQSGQTRVVTVKAAWIVLDRSDLGKLLVGRPAGASAPQVDVAAMEKAQIKPAYQAQITCFAGQTVYLAGGHGETVVTALEPLVSENAAAIKPEMKMVHWGAMLEITPVLSARDQTVTADVHSVVAEPTGAARPAYKIETDTKPGAGSSSMDRLAFSLQDFRTTVKAPLGVAVLAGGTTMPDNGEGKGLYLILEISGP